MERNREKLIETAAQKGFKSVVDNPFSADDKHWLFYLCDMQQWLRTRGLHIEASYKEYATKGNNGYYFTVDTERYNYGLYDSYEEALEGGLINVLTLR